jgi:hypothetical protein
VLGFSGEMALKAAVANVTDDKMKNRLMSYSGIRI